MTCLTLNRLQQSLMIGRETSIQANVCATIAGKLMIKLTRSLQENPVKTQQNVDKVENNIKNPEDQDHQQTSGN